MTSFLFKFDREPNKPYHDFGAIDVLGYSMALDLILRYMLCPLSPCLSQVSFLGSETSILDLAKVLICFQLSP